VKSEIIPRTEKATLGHRDALCQLIVVHHRTDIVIGNVDLMVEIASE